MNKKRYWFRFGLIFGVVALVVCIPAIFMMFGFSPNILGGSIITGIGSFVIWPVQLAVEFIGLRLIDFSGNFVREYIYLAVMILALIPGIFYFIIGVIVGGIYGKIKNRSFSINLDHTVYKYNNKKIVLFCLLVIIIELVYFTLVSRTGY